MTVNYFEGIPIGRYERNENGFPQIIIYNHLEIKVKTQTRGNTKRIVGFEVEPFSISEGPNRSLNDPE